MKKIIKDGQIVGFTDLDPILEEGYTAEEATVEEYEAWKKANEPQPIHYITIEAPLEVMITRPDFKEKVAFIQLIYSQLETITKKGIVYISHIDITDVKDFLPKEELDLFTSYGVKFPPEVHDLYNENINPPSPLGQGGNAEEAEKENEDLAPKSEENAETA